MLCFELASKCFFSSWHTHFTAGRTRYSSPPLSLDENLSSQSRLAFFQSRGLFRYFEHHRHTTPTSTLSPSHYHPFFWEICHALVADTDNLCFPLCCAFAHTGHNNYNLRSCSPFVTPVIILNQQISCGHHATSHLAPSNLWSTHQISGPIFDQDYCPASAWLSLFHVSTPRPSTIFCFQYLGIPPEQLSRTYSTRRLSISLSLTTRYLFAQSHLVVHRSQSC